MSKFESRDVKAWRLDAHIINRTFLRNTLRLIQLSVLHHISTKRYSYHREADELIIITLNKDMKFMLSNKTMI